MMSRHASRWVLGLWHSHPLVVLAVIATLTALLWLRYRAPRGGGSNGSASDEQRGESAWSVQDAPIARGRKNERLSFEYVDADGEVTERTLVNWTEYENYFDGLCLDRRAKRTFRKDRVLQWFECGLAQPEPGRPRTAGDKMRVSVSLDPEVVAFFKRGGPGWHQRVNEALRHAMMLSVGASRRP